MLNNQPGPSNTVNRHNRSERLKFGVTRLGASRPLVLGLILLSVHSASAHHPDNPASSDQYTPPITGLTQDWADQGFEFAVGLTTIYQQNVHGGGRNE